MLYMNCELFSMQNIQVCKNPVSVLFFVRIFIENLPYAKHWGYMMKKT